MSHVKLTFREKNAILIFIVKRYIRIGITIFVFFFFFFFFFFFSSGVVYRISCRRQTKFPTVYPTIYRPNETFDI